MTDIPDTDARQTEASGLQQANVETESLSSSRSAFDASNSPEYSECRPVGWFPWLREGLRANILLRVRELPAGPSAWQMLCIVGVTSVLVTVLSRYEIAGPATFSIRTWLFGWATTGLLIAGIWLTMTWGRHKSNHPTPVAAWFLVYCIAMLPIGLISTALSVLYAHKAMPNWWTPLSWYAWAVYAWFWVWVAIATWRTATSITRSRRVVFGVVLWVLVVEGLNSFTLRTRAWEPFIAEEVDDIGEEASASKFPAISQEVFETQQALFAKALQGIKTHHGKQRQVYALIYAPYSQDVFLRESAMVQQVLETSFGAHGHLIRLVNHNTTATTIPWATNLNLERSLQALANAMNREQDVIVVYLTSHGGSNFKLATSNWPLEVKELTAPQLRAMLDKTGILNRVIAVSACYSGGWVEPLQSDNTLVMTAADKDHTSYGCGNKSDLTFFGRAVFDEQLRNTLSFEGAFRAAVPIIKQREIDGGKDDGFSNPQISVGVDIQRVLDELVQQLNTQRPADGKSSGKS